MIDIPKIVTKIGIKPTFRLERNGATVTPFESLSFHWLFSRHAFHHSHISMKKTCSSCALGHLKMWSGAYITAMELPCYGVTGGTFTLIILVDFMFILCFIATLPYFEYQRILSVD
jgi:hypothetical protein